MFLCDHAFGAVPAQEHLKKRRNETNGIMQTKTCQQDTPNDHRVLVFRHDPYGERVGGPTCVHTWLAFFVFFYLPLKTFDKNCI